MLRACSVALVFLLSLILSNPARAEEKAKVAARLGALPAQLAKAKKGDNEVLDELFRATIKRVPLPTERENAMRFLRKNKERQRAYQDIVWALMNTREFLTIHGFTIPEGMRFSEMVMKEWRK